MAIAASFIPAIMNIESNHGQARQEEAPSTESDVPIE